MKKPIIREIKIYRILAWIIVIAWMIIILNLSSQVADQSNQLSTGIIEKILTVVRKILPNVSIEVDSMNHVLRKSAHFFAYLVLGILLLNAFEKSNVKGSKRLILVLVICIIYALSDEIHQLFVPGRGGRFQDVIIDCLGAGSGVGLYMLMSRIRQKK